MTELHFCPNCILFLDVETVGPYGQWSCPKCSYKYELNDDPSDKPYLFIDYLDERFPHAFLDEPIETFMVGRTFGIRRRIIILKEGVQAEDEEERERFDVFEFLIAHRKSGQIRFQVENPDDERNRFTSDGTEICAINVSGNIWVSPDVLAYVDYFLGLAPKLVEKKADESMISSEAGGVKVPTVCAICTDGFKLDDATKVVPRCGHFFHVSCLSPWLERSATCPTCRAVINSGIPNYRDTGRSNRV